MQDLYGLMAFCASLDVYAKAPLETFEDFFKTALDDMPHDALLALRDDLDKLLDSYPTEENLREFWRAASPRWRVRTGSPNAWRHLFEALRSEVSVAAKK
jgi:hypothetical protein